jgi:hypothetical protein
MIAGMSLFLPIEVDCVPSALGRREGRGKTLRGE